MAKLQNYKGSVTLISGIKQANGQDFPLAEANAIQIDENGKRLDEALDELNKGLSSSPIKSGTDEGGNSIPRTAVFDGNKVYTKGGVSLGQNTSAGGKCFILRSGKKETKGCSLVVGFMTDDEFNTLSGLVAGGLYISARLDYNFDGYKVTKIEKVTDGKVADGDVRFTLDSEFRAVEGKNWYAESNFPDRLTADKAACVSVGTNTPENTVKTATLWVIGHPEVGTFGIDELVDTDGNIVSAHSEGYKNVAHNIGAHAEGRNTKAEGKYSHTEGDDTTAGYGSHAEGKLTKALGNTTHAEGHQTECSPQSANAHAEGYGTKVTSIAGHAEGLGSSATADAAHAEGSRTNAKGYGSHSEGYYAAASGAQSHAEGCGTKAIGESSHAEGDGTQANGKYSHAGGYRTRANNDAETAVGKYNKSDADTLYSVGNGTSDTNRKNAFEIKKNGDAYFEGKGYAGGKELASVPEVSDITGTTIVIKDNNVFSMAECTSLSVSADDSMKTIISASELIFVSGSTATVFSSGEIIYKGNDCVGGVFTPVTNKRYSIMYGYNGTAVYGLVLGFEVSA